MCDSGIECAREKPEATDSGGKKHGDEERRSLFQETKRWEQMKNWLRMIIARKYEEEDGVFVYMWRVRGDGK